MIYTRSELIVLPIALLCILILSITSYFILKNKSEKQQIKILGILSTLGIFAIIINLIGRRAIHRFVKSLYTSVENQSEEFVALKSVQFWIIAFTVISIGAEIFAFLANPVTIFMFLQRALYYAALIVGVIMINRYLKSDNT